MKKILTALAIFLAISWACSAIATPVSLDIADGSNGSNINMSNVDTGLRVEFGTDLWVIDEQTDITMSLDSYLGDQTTTLDKGDVLIRNNLIQSLSLANGTVLEIAIKREYEIGRATYYNVSTIIPKLLGGPLRASPVPEPATVLLFGTGLVGLATLRRWKKE